ncbi:MAG: hypothetical protein U0235_07970 [Polyangiaceae bacterium]
MSVRIRSVTVAIIALAGLPLACTLSARPSDYFDPSGNTTMLARFDEGAPENLALTADALFASVGTRVIRVDKASGVVRTVTELTSPPASVVVGLGGRVVVCDRDRGVLVFEPTAPFAEVAVPHPSGDRACLTAAASDTRIAYVPELPADAPSDATPEVDQIFANGSTTKASLPFGKQGSADSPPVPSLAFVGDDVVVLLRGGIGRWSATDFCVLLRADTPKVRPQKIAGNATVTLAMGGGDRLHMVAASTTCCPKTAPNACDRAPNVTVASPVDWVLTRAYLYYLSEGAVSRRSMARLSDPSAEGDERFEIAGGSALAVEPDDSAAYVSVGTRLVRRMMR